ncbi:hypothetical protein ACFL47_07580 [Candidatus Latescibacterota bacterium]
MKRMIRSGIILQFAVVTIMFAYLMTGYAEAQDNNTKSFLQRSRDQRSQEVTWKKAAGFTFDKSSDLNRYPIPEGKWEIAGGKLRAIDGDRNRAILLTKNVGDPVRIEFDATNTANSEGFLGDITVLLNSVDSNRFFGNGYALTTSSYWNNCTTFYRKGKSIARTEYTPVVSGVKNHVVLEFVHGHIRYWLNGEIILEAWDQEPLEMEDGNWIGIRTWATDMVVDNVVVYRGE